MRRTHRLTSRSIRWISLATSFLLFLSSLGLTPSGKRSVRDTRAQQDGNGKARKVLPKPPEPGAPALNLPNLDEARQRTNAPPGVARAIESASRSRRKPLEPRLGRKVGDPIPRATPSPAPSPTPQPSPSPTGTPRRSPSPSPSPTPSASPDVSRSGSGSQATVVASQFGKARFRALDHLALKFLTIDLAKDHINWLPRSSSPNNFHESSFDLLVPPVPQSGATKIVFASNREGDMHIFVMNADGSGLVRLTYSGAHDDYPRW
jgi:hypothetical protein